MTSRMDALQPRPVIQVLSQHVANQIAAGEVIERPAAVVKELLENSIDAGATRIEVEYRNGGKAYLRIEDDGCGMSPAEALLAFQRHATSKLRDTEDLAKILTMGFRGEALPSIASVAKFTLRTRPADQAVGCEIVFAHGRQVHSKECGMPQGTRIEITDLFQSVPARRKFLKSDSTEAGHILYLCRLYAIAHPEISLRVIEDGRVVLRSPRCRQAVDRVGEIWNRRLAAELQELPRASSDTMQLHGLISKPGQGRSTRQEMITVVNGRPVDSRTLNQALMEAYRSRIPPGRYPAAFLFLQLPAAAVDVNIHPTKREIRFRDENAVRTLVREAVLAALIEKPDPVATLSPLPPDLPPPLPSLIPSAVQPQPALPTRRALSEAERGLLHLAEPVAAVPLPVALPAAAPAVKAEGAAKSWHFKARLQHNLALFETEQGLLLFNWRAAHERIVYEQVLRQFEQAAEPAVQGLLLPVVVELDALEAAAVAESLDLLRQQGFQMERFGGDSYRIEAVPTWLEQDGVESFIHDLAGLLRERGSTQPNQANTNLARLAASRALRQRDQPTEQEIVYLQQQLQQCSEPLICPRGRPVWVAYHWSEIQRKFQ